MENGDGNCIGEGSWTENAYIFNLKILEITDESRKKSHKCRSFLLILQK